MTDARESAEQAAPAEVARDVALDGGERDAGLAPLGSEIAPTAADGVADDRAEPVGRAAAGAESVGRAVGCGAYRSSTISKYFPRSWPTVARATSPLSVRYTTSWL